MAERKDRTLAEACDEDRVAGVCMVLTNCGMIAVLDDDVVVEQTFKLRGDGTGSISLRKAGAWGRPAPEPERYRYEGDPGTTSELVRALARYCSERGFPSAENVCDGDRLRVSFYDHGGRKVWERRGMTPSNDAEYEELLERLRKELSGPGLVNVDWGYERVRPWVTMGWTRVLD